VLPERPTMNGGPAYFESHLKVAVHPQPVSPAQGPGTHAVGDGSFPEDRAVIHGRGTRVNGYPVNSSILINPGLYWT
jgi:hypothetical protein